MRSKASTCWRLTGAGINTVQRAISIERKRGRAEASPITSEFQLHRWTVQLLHRLCYSHVLYFHVPNGEERTDRTAGKLAVMGVLAGVPDLQIFVQGKPHFLELKHGKNGLTSAQETFKAYCDGHGIPYAIANNQDEVARQLEEWKVIRPTGWQFHGFDK